MPPRSSSRAQDGRRGAQAKTRARETPQKPEVVSVVDSAQTEPFSAIYGAMTEAELQRTIRAYLRLRGFTVWVFPIMKRTMAGVPDLTFWHPERPGLLWFWELKRQRGRIRPEQATTLQHLATVPGVDARIVRPDDWPWLRDKLERNLFAPAPVVGARAAGEDGR